METRRFGRTNHFSSVAVFGGVALLKATPRETDAIIEKVIQAGVNQIDVAPEYGLAEERLGPWMKRLRAHFFLGCKTLERREDTATVEMHTSLRKLQVEQFDLYQLHCVSTMEDLDLVTGAGGAVETLQKAREAGIARFVGITAHGINAPSILIAALQRFDFDSVIFPVNFVLFANPDYSEKTAELISLCQSRDVGRLGIKATCQGPYPGEKLYNTWYLPFTDSGLIRQGVDFALSQDIAGVCTVGEPSLLPEMLQACQDYSRLDTSQQKVLFGQASQFTPLWR